VLRAWFMSELKITLRSVDDLAGTPDGYVQKLIGKRARRALGPVSLGPILQAGGLHLIVVADAEKISELRRNHRWKEIAQNAPYKRRRRRYAHEMLTRLKICPRLGNSEWGKALAARRMTQLSARERALIASNAGVVRWTHAREEAKRAAELRKKVAEMRAQNVFPQRKRRRRHKKK
jgi:hypothetical protein